MQDRVMRAICLMSAWLLTACSPVPEHSATQGGASSLPASSSLPGWHRVYFLEGLSIATPLAAKVEHLQGIDTRVMEISGPGYALRVNNPSYFRGLYRKARAIRLAGRSATIETRTKADCRHQSIEIELPRKDATQTCAPEYKGCTVPNASVPLTSSCKGAEACGTLDLMVASARLGPAADPIFVEPRDHLEKVPICSVE